MTCQLSQVHSCGLLRHSSQSSQMHSSSFSLHSSQREQIQCSSNFPQSLQRSQIQSDFFSSQFSQYSQVQALPGRAQPSQILSIGSIFISLLSNQMVVCFGYIHRLYVAFTGQIYVSLDLVAVICTCVIQCNIEQFRLP